MRRYAVERLSREHSTLLKTIIYLQNSSPLYEMVCDYRLVYERPCFIHYQTESIDYYMFYAEICWTKMIYPTWISNKSEYEKFFST